MRCDTLQQIQLSSYYVVDNRGFIHSRAFQNCQHIMYNGKSVGQWQQSLEGVIAFYFTTQPLKIFNIKCKNLIIKTGVKEENNKLIFYFKYCSSGSVKYIYIDENGHHLIDV